MGNRVKGKTKLKSIKAAKSSNMGSKRKLSRMGKSQKKDHSGIDATFISRTAALKRLFITLKDFRRLCILKGIYPREPRGRAPGNKKGQTFYHIRDITHIAHEPLLAKFREFKAYMKKVRKASGRNEKEEAKRLDSLAPKYTLNHLVKERYPRFVDALGDLDDALSMIGLFAALPSEGRIKSKITNKCKSLIQSWHAYCAKTASLTKSFISVKGMYFEAVVMGVTVRWVIPHSFTQNLPKDVDFRVMSTFVEFYDVLLSFTLFKLFNSIGLKYPFAVADGDERGASIAGVLKIMEGADGKDNGNISKLIASSKNENEKGEEKKEEKVKKVVKKAKRNVQSMDIDAITGGDNSDDDDDENGSSSDEEEEDISAPLTAALASISHPDDIESKDGLADENNGRKKLFRNLTFFASREVPRTVVELLVISYGARVGWEGSGSPILPSDRTITHHVVDRPALPAAYSSYPKNREYVQPQWVFDCANHMILLPCSKYSVGVDLPPHLSPWVNNEEEGYTPRYAQEIAVLKSGEEAVEEEQDSDSEGEGELEKAEAGSDDEDEEEEEEEEEVILSKKEKAAKKKVEEEGELARIMMSKKATRLYGRMQHGIEEKQGVVDTLVKKRKAIEKEERAESKRPKIVIVDNTEEDDILKKKDARNLSYVKAERISLRNDQIRGKERDEKGRTGSKQKVDRLKSKRVKMLKKYEEK